jgi:hypothetical protein
MGEFWTERERGDREDILRFRRKLYKNEFYNLSRFRLCMCVAGLSQEN